MSGQFKCPKCGKTMEEGYTLDLGYRAGEVASWVAGAPERSIWTGLKTRNREHIPIRTFRCSGCGYLESYANKAD